MARIAFILLCHKDPEGIIRQVRQLTEAGDCVAIHFDARAPRAAFERLAQAFDDDPAVAFAERVKCGWGEWSLVQGTLNAIEAARAAFADATHFYMLSGDCMPIKTAEYTHALLDAEPADYIESFDYFTSGWIKTGLREERLIYRHYFNERANKALFYAAMSAQQRLGLRRAPPADLRMRIGSQWWCLRRETIEAVLRLVADRHDIVRFFRTTWIPDETFFQTLVPHLVAEAEIRTHTLTFLMFSDYGMPVAFYNDQYEMLLAQDFLFARKISAEAATLKQRLGELYARRGVGFETAGGGRTLYGYLSGRGRIGRRFARRFWEQQTTLGRDRELLMVICKKWHVAKRLIARITNRTGLPVVAYLFEEEGTQLPDLGGLESSLTKRARHRRAVMRILFDYYATQRMAICVDPSHLGLVADFAKAGCGLRLLEVECRLDDGFVEGHARRRGLLGAATPGAVRRQVLQSVRQDMEIEAEELRDADLAPLFRLREAGSAALNARALAGFLRDDTETAHDIIDPDYLFSD